MKHFSWLAALLVVLCLSVPPAFTQATATLVGTVYDPSGAVVQNATVEAQNTATGFKRTVRSDGSGGYSISALPTGPYSVTTTSPGFRSSKVENVILQIDQQARVDVALALGNTEQVNVTAAPSLIQTDTSSISQVIDNRKVLDLPLVSRNFADLVALTPGALTSDNYGGPSSGEQHGFTTAAIAGGQSSKTEFLFDGISNSEELFDGVQFTPSIDFTQEFRVQSNAFPAQYGRGSAVVLISSRAGTNALHGTVFEFLRNDAADAQNRNFSSIPVKKPPLRRNDFGGSLGGPILRDKLFFFLNYEGLRQTNPIVFSNILVPSLLERSGDFSRSNLNSSGVARVLTNPSTGLPYPGNQVPIDAAAKYLLQFTPLASNSATDPTANTYTRSASNTDKYDQGNARVDYTLSERDNLFGRFSIQDGEAANPGVAPTNGGSSRVNQFRNVTAGYTHIFTPRLLNEFRVGYNHLYTAGLPQGLGTNYTTKAGILGFDQVSTTFPGFPNVSAGSYQITNGSIFLPIVNPTTTWNVIDSATYSLGRHTVVAGIDIRRYHFTSTNGAWSRGFFNYGGDQTGSALSDFIAGYPGGFNARSYPRDIFGERTFDFPLFVQDDWKLKNNLTLNLGVRYDLALAPTQDFGANSYYDVKTGKWIVGTVDGKVNLNAQRIEALSYKNFAQYIVTAQQAGVDSNLQTISKKNVAPRIGFAWRPYGGDKTVFRGGYGIFYLLPRGNNTVTSAIVNVPFIFDNFAGNSSPNAQHPATPFTTENLFSQPYGSSESLVSASQLHIRPPYNQEWNLALQQDLTQGLAMQIAYVANRGTRLERNFPLNYATPDNPLASTSVASRRQDAQLNPFAAGGASFTESGNSYYHSLQTTLERRAARGVTFLAAYTWSKLIDDKVVGSDNYSDDATVQDPTNLRRDRGRGQGDITHRVVVSYVYPLPFGRGEAYGANLPRGLDLALGGWKLSGIAQFQSGAPFSLGFEGDPLNVGGEYGRRPDQIRANVGGARTIHQWFDPSAFAVPQPGTIGNSGRNTLTGPRYQNFDFSLLKGFHYSESKYVELRIEAFNALNHPNLFGPNTDISSPQAGQINGSADPRRMQAGAKIYF